MREIKFKAWLKKEYFSVLNPENKVYDVENLDFDTQQAYLSECGWCDFKDIELMQYTGLKDKNGAEIYEGYIVEYYGKNAVVTIGFPHDEKWYPYGICVEYIKYNLKEVEYVYKLNLEDLEVIGNIYENPELLTA